jgi:hypothetical protein
MDDAALNTGDALDEDVGEAPYGGISQVHNT